MNELHFMKDYKDNEILRKSFNELATMIFGIHFEEWYQKGFWNNRYIPCSYLDGDKVVANVSVNLLDLVIDGEKKNAIQLGTVMTHPDYRKRGLSARLMNKVLEEYENQYDFMYLFANQTVLDFYPKFGFNSVNEYQYSMTYTPSQVEMTGVRKLDGHNADDVQFIFQFVSERKSVSERFGTVNAHGILMFYCMYVFNDDIYYLEREDVIVIYKKDNKQLDIFDVISKKYIHINEILSKIAVGDIEKIVFHYMPDDKGINAESTIYHGSDVLFVRANGNQLFPSKIKHPITSQA
jgi:predicted N-acetyltransferase YhbS